MYSQRTKDRAFELYGIHRSLLKVVSQLRKEISEAKNIDRKTVAKWKSEDNWSERVSEVREKYLKDRDAELAEQMEEYELEFDEIIDRLFMELRDLTPKSFSEGIYTLQTAMAQRQKLRGQAGETDKEEIIAKVFKALNNMEWFKHAMSDDKQRREALAAVETEFTG